jgi:hypothetical protein
MAGDNEALVGSFKTRDRALADLAFKIAENGEDLFAQPAFYAEFAPLQDHSDFVDSIYVLKDRGRLN